MRLAKLKPAVNLSPIRLTAGLIAISYLKLGYAHNKLNYTAKSHCPSMDQSMKINCKQLSFSYEKKRIFSNLSFSASAQDHIWIKGPSGVGKSTLLKILCGIERPQSGSIQIDEFSLTQLTPKNLMKFRLDNVGYIHQDNHLIDHWTVQQNLSLYNSNNEIQETLEKLKLDKNILKSLAQNLSGGEKQRLNIAKLILKKPKLALIDEPTSHLDDENSDLVLNLISKELRSSTVVLISHDARLEKYKLKPLNFTELGR